jgi:hypothetical protein
MLFKTKKESASKKVRVELTRIGQTAASYFKERASPTILSYLETHYASDIVTQLLKDFGLSIEA